MLKSHYETFARYNRWANARVYRMAAQLPDDLYRRDVGAFFGSLHGTLNHILVADRIWMRRLTGDGPYPDKLDAILFDDLTSLTTAREAEDARIVAAVEALTEEEIAAEHSYRTLDGRPQNQPLAEILAHVFNHQTHHRGQVHGILTHLGVTEPEPLDLLYMFREMRQAAR